MLPEPRFRVPFLRRLELLYNLLQGRHLWLPLGPIHGEAEEYARNSIVLAPCHLSSCRTIAKVSICCHGGVSTVSHLPVAAVSGTVKI